MPFAFGTCVAAIVPLNKDAGGGIPRAELCRTPSKRDGLTLSQRGFAFSCILLVYVEKRKAVVQPRDLQISSDDFPTSIAPSVHLMGPYENLHWIGTDF